jgi:AraC-like DNA-binding protein
MAARKDALSNPVLSSKQCFGGPLGVYYSRFYERDSAPEANVHGMGRRLHSHSFIEVAYVLGGRGVQRIGGRTFGVVEGDLFILPAGIAHMFMAGDPDERLQIVNLGFPPETLYRLFDFYPRLCVLEPLFDPSNCRPAEDELPCGMRVEGDARDAILSLIDGIHGEGVSLRHDAQDMCVMLLSQLLLVIVRAATKSSEMLGRSESSGSIVRGAISLINKRYREKLSIAEIAAHSFVCPQHLSREFKRATGMSVLKYIQHLRVQDAAVKLADTDMTVEEIAVNVGYGDAAFFIRVFAEHTGVTPGKYRGEIMRLISKRGPR